MSKVAIPILLCLIVACRHQPGQIGAPSVTSPVFLKAGTTLAFRTAQAIDLYSSKEGRTFAVVVSREVADVNGQTVLPSGSPATLVARPIISGGSGLELALASVTLNGDSFLTSSDAKAGTAEAGSLGTFIGGVPGRFQPGDEPPRLTATEPIRCPPGSLLTFRLDRSILLTGSHQ